MAAINIPEKLSQFQDDITNKVSKIAKISLGGNRIVELDSENNPVYADKETSKRVVGITLNAANIDDNVIIQTAGEITDPSWNWIVGKSIYLGNNGLLIQTVPISGYLIVMGYATEPTKVMINIKPSIKLI